jgi:hypothetical protein
MRRVQFHFSLRGLLASVALFAVCCSALVAATPLAASAMHTLNLALLATAIVGAICRTGQARAYWVAVAAAGWVYYFAAVAWPAPLPAVEQLTSPSYYSAQSPQDSRPELLTSRFLAWLEGKRNLRLPVGTHVMAQWMGGGYWAGTISDVNTETGYLIKWDDGSSPTWDTPAQIGWSTTPFYQTGHAAFGILLSLLAGWLASSVFRDERSSGQMPL